MADLPAGRQVYNNGWRARHLIYFYILKCTNKKFFYKGLTSNLGRRLNQHLSGNVKSTKRYLPLELVYVELCNDRDQARSLEKFYKSGQGREIIQELFL